MALASFNRHSYLDSVTSRDSHMSEDQGELSLCDVHFIIVGANLKKNTELKAAIQKYECPVEYCESAMDYLKADTDFDTVFVLDSFEGTAYHTLHRSGARIMAPPVIIRCAANDESIPNNTRPLYNSLMKDVVICFTGFKRKEQLSLLADLVHHMGGSIRKEFGPRVTHLVANCTGGEKYRAAVSRGRTIMGEDWVHKTWELRNNYTVHATDEEFNQYRLAPFSYTCLSFHGFPREEQQHMEDMTIQNGGSYAAAGAPNCTHLVVDEHTVKTIPFELHSRLYVVKSEWFWASIQMEACADESMYFFREERLETPGSCKSTTPHTLSGGKGRKRKRLKENLAHLANVPEVDSPMVPNKRKSTEAGFQSMSASFLDVTTDNSVDQSGADLVSPPAKTPAVPKPSSRWQVAMELLQTETNYVGILHTIYNTIKGELEDEKQPGGAILPPTEVKLIFSKLGPIYEIHTKIREELNQYMGAWKEDHSVGSIILKHADKLLKAYPPFVNFYTNTKSTIIECERKYPRFHAFLKVCQNRSECGRQTLTELFIRPVQRLPSVILLLKDLLKKTDDTNPDHPQLILALERLEDVLKHINEDKRKTEGQLAMLNIFNDIDNCPPNLLSSHRSFILSVDVVDLTNTLSGKGDNVTLFLFSDSLELCKRRIRSAKSPAVTTRTPQKAYKHLEMLQLGWIKRVVDITDRGSIKDVFALVVRKGENEEEILYSFQLVENTNKQEFLKTLSKHISNFICRADYENLLTGVEAHVLNIEPGDLNQGNSTLSRAATKFSKRVSRAFSFNKTPRKLKRAMSSMSQMISPFRRESGLDTPTNSMAAMRMASVNDLSDLDSPRLGVRSTPNGGFRTPSTSRKNFL